MSVHKDKKLEVVYLFHLEKTYKQFKKYKKDFFKNIGVDLTSDQWIVLKRISETEGINQKDLADSTYKEPASVTRILDILERKSWIERRNTPDDRRSYELYLTEEGKKTVEHIIPAAQKIRAQGVEGLSEEEVQQLVRTLNQIYNNLK